MPDGKSASDLFADRVRDAPRHGGPPLVDRVSFEMREPEAVKLGSATLISRMSWRMSAGILGWPPRRRDIGRQSEGASITEPP
jgi:hypothetical protein